MARIDRLTPLFLDYMPEELEDGVLYISERFQIALHNCCCGCGEEVSTPLSATEYRLIKHGDTVSLRPSIGNHDFPCRSHYWIEHNRITWSGAMTRQQIDEGRVYDRSLKRGRRRGIAAVIGRVLGWFQSWWKS